MSASWNWLPGDTAPRDGTPIIGYWKGRTPELDCCKGIVWREPEVIHDKYDAGAWIEIGGADDVVVDPDGWTPMPNRESSTEYSPIRSAA
jgi:hypothetical protein